MSNWNVSPLRDPLDAYFSIAGEALLYSDRSIWETYVKRIGSENLRGVWDGEQFVGGLAFYRMGQWFGGQAIPTAGISGVAIDPAARGSGACRALLTSLLRELHAEGIPLASLYASTQRLYRGVGFEQSGHRFQYSIPMSSLHGSHNKVSRDLSVTRLVDPPLDVLDRIATVRARSSNGLLQRTAGLWERVTQPIGATTTTYLIGEPTHPEGFATLQHGARSAGLPQPLVAIDWVANTAAAMQRLIALVTDHRSLCDQFRWYGGPNDPLHLLASEQYVAVTDHIRSLNRIIRFQDAFELRGYPSGLSGELHFSVRDELLPENHGNWTLKLNGGKAQVERGGEGHIQLAIRAAAPLFTGLVNCSQLIAADMIACTHPAQVQLADLVFAGPAPWMPEIF